MLLVMAKCYKCDKEFEMNLSEDAVICLHCDSALVSQKARDYYNSANKIDNSSSDFIISKGTLVKYRGELDKVEIPSKVKFIGSKVFQNSGITEVTMHEGIIGINGAAFENCIGITEIILPESVEIIKGAAFKGCTRLTSINIPDNVTKIGNSAFERCVKLKSITIPNSVTEIDGTVFFGCKELTEVNTENENAICALIEAGIFSQEKLIDIATNSKEQDLQTLAVKSLYQRGKLSKLSQDKLTEIANNSFDDNIAYAAFGILANQKTRINDSFLSVFGKANSSLVREKLIEILTGKRSEQGLCIYCGGEQKTKYVKKSNYELYLERQRAMTENKPKGYRPRRRYNPSVNYSKTANTGLIGTMLLGLSETKAIEVCSENCGSSFRIGKVTIKKEVTIERNEDNDFEFPLYDVSLYDE